MYKKLFMAAALMAVSLQADAQTLAKEYKSTGEANPISSCVFCADPTAIVYDGRLYVYGSNDNQQYIKNGKTGGNGYGDIKSLVVFSTDDMVNWTFHGTIDVGKLCSSWGWRFAASWAPSAVWRTNANGQDEFFLYFANSGGSVGVLKASSPVGPWSSPLSKPMIDGETPGVRPCNWIFDPGAVVDEDGTGWIAFGGGDPQSSGSSLWPGNSRIAKLKPSMTALDGSAVNMPAPYMFEASELNIIGGRYVYTYNTSWSDRNDWNSFTGNNNQPAPTSCSMCYMVSDTPLDPDSWDYRGEYVPNEGNFGMGWGNNHTHLQKFKDKYFLFYHSTILEQRMKDDGAMNSEASGYRSIGVDEATVNESTQTINKMTLTTAGVTAIGTVNPYELQESETMATSAGISYEDFTNITKNTSISNLGNDASRNMQVKMRAGSWTLLRRVDFGTKGATSFMLRAKGEGTVEVRIGRRGAKPSATFNVSSNEMTDNTVEVDASKFNGQKNIYFVVSSGTDVYLDAWQATETQPDAVQDIDSGKVINTRRYDLSGRRIPDSQEHRGLVIEQYTDENGVKHSRKTFSKEQTTK
jgi:arabinoxylan arabinofuranohydrolase